MRAIGLPPLSPRTVPAKGTIAPVCGRPCVSRRISAPTSKSSACTRTAIMSPSGDGREKRDLAHPGDAGGRLDVGAVESDADHLGPRKRLRIFGASRLEPGDELLRSLDP